MEQPVVSGIAFNRDEAKVTVIGVPDTPGAAARILAPIGEANIEVDVILQNISADNTTDLTFTVHRNEVEKAQSVLEAAAAELGAKEIKADSKVAKVSIVGVGMRSHAGVASTMFSALADEGINIQMITTSEIKIAVIIEERYLELAVRALHSAFDLESEPVLES
jgi:aspartate kinase